MSRYIQNKKALRSVACRGAGWAGDFYLIYYSSPGGLVPHPCQGPPPGRGLASYSVVPSGTRKKSPAQRSVQLPVGLGILFNIFKIKKRPAALLTR